MPDTKPAGQKPDAADASGRAEESAAPDGHVGVTSGPDGQSKDAATSDGRADGVATRDGAESPGRPRVPADAASANASEQPTQADQAPGGQPAPLRLPERPQLASGVKLAGQMQESAFVDPPWLLEREEAGYIQVTELLYRVAEQCDGQNTTEQIAEKVSEAINRQVSADNVLQLITKQLLPKGLVADADGRVVAAAEGGAGRSPLAVNMKMAMLSPRLLAPLVTILKVLFLPPIYFGVLAVSAVALFWMYFIHGINGSLQDALYAPGLMLAVLAVIIVSAGFHELGHGAALEYGGGKLKGMGAGIYLVYPAFYTDVSDNYRLKRWARIRTDLGGFYFNLIFALGIIGLYFLTGVEFLLLVVTLIVIEIVHQLMPFVRLDGYWTLADVTGVPDFFSQMAAYVRSVLPFMKLEGRKLPELKWWAKAVFGLYMLITLPLLAFLLFGMIRGLPRILATAWDAFLQQVGAFSQAQAAGNVVGMAGAGIQILILALPTLGICYTLFNLGRRVLTGVWSWSKPTPTRRLIGSLGTLGTLGLIAFLWAPQLPFGGGQPGPAYRHYQESFRPLTRDDRGTVFDIAGAPQPGWLPAPLPSPAAEPSATVAPGPEATAQSGPTAEPTPGGTPAANVTPTAAVTPSVAATTVPTTQPALAPNPPAKAPPAPVVAPTAPPAPTVAPTAPPALTVAPTAPLSTPPAGQPKPAPTTGSAPGFAPPGGAAPTATPGPLRP